MEINTIIQGDCLEVMKDIPDNSVDAIVTDPPYELGFMGKKWDNSGIAYNVEMWKECLRVLKPGGHLLSFGGTRTYHRMASAIEDAGFEVRDMIEYIYGSGFPKSLNIGKAVDKIQGNEREVVGVSEGKGYSSIQEKNIEQDNRPYVDGLPYLKADRTLTKGTSPYEGWGTALKPAHEPICMARKPLAEKTVAENCLKYGTGGINIDESRVESSEKLARPFNVANNQTFGKYEKFGNPIEPTGRFPANLIHDGSEEVVGLFPNCKGASSQKFNKHQIYGGNSLLSSKTILERDHYEGFNDSGSAARFFYCAKASKSERNKGCEDMEDVNWWELNEGGGKELWKGQEDYRQGKKYQNHPSKNFHPTVKPIALMEYLIKMVTPKGGIVLDPFAGSGSTLVAAKQNGFDYIGIEITEEYIPIIEARLSDVKDVQEELFNNHITNLKEK